MTASEETMKKPLWLSIEESFLELNLQDLSGGNKEAAIQEIASKLDSEGYNVLGYGGNMLQLRWAMDEMLKVGRPLMKDFNDAIEALSLEDVADPYSATLKLIDDLGNTWKELKKSNRRATVIEIVEKTRLYLLIKKAKNLPDDESIRFLITEKVASEVIVNELGITEEKLGQVNAEIEKEKAERARVVSLLEAADGKSKEEQVKHLFDNNVSENLIIELAEVDQGVIDSVKQAMEEELKEKQRLEEEAAAKRKAAAEGPSMEEIPPDQMLEYIEAIREILEFSDVEKEIRVMCEQSSIPKSLVDIAVSEPGRLDELEKEAEG
jgi:hypothetical protein